MSGPARSSLLGELDVDVALDVPIGAMTWYGIGGRADMLVSPRSEEALTELVRRCHAEDVPVRVLGGGANLLVDDDGVDGVVVKLDNPAFRMLHYNVEGHVDTAMAMGGTDLFRMVPDLARRGLRGFEMMAGIPGTLGGAVRMNAGGTWGQVADCLQVVTLLDLDGTVHAFQAGDLQFRYRASDLPEGIVLHALLHLEEDDPLAVRQRVKDVFAQKRATQPMADHSAGCAFRNPLDESSGRHLSAGRLIDESGLKGMRVGGAVVSDQHANFIIAEPGASAADVRRLIDEVRRAVATRQGITLQPEVVIWHRDGAS